jgi:short-subunit dehydrogenase
LQSTFTDLQLLPRRHPAMRSRNYGRIVNIASVAGKDGNPTHRLQRQQGGGDR